jgi:hypothetical protein
MAADQEKQYRGHKLPATNCMNIFLLVGQPPVGYCCTAEEGSGTLCATVAQ